jgi:hypothetical protein
MATQLPVGPFRDQTYLAAEDLSDYQWHMVRLASATTVEVGAADETVMGVLQNAPESGEQAVVRTAGESFMYVDGTTDIAVSDPVDCDASGHGVKQASDKGWIIGHAREAYTSATPGIIVVDVHPTTIDV